MTAANRLGAGSALRRIREGSLDCVTLMRATLDEIRRREPELHCWAVLDEERAMARARAADATPAQARGALHGLPLAVKDTYDTSDFPTEWGGSAWRGRRPPHDALMVKRARAAGAIVIGKAITTEYALLHPGPTRNPHDPARTPGGSSSGSAAAVAAFMAALGLGSQTNGSMLRPASYCGIYGLKPTFGLLPRAGLQPIAAPLDTPGLFSRDLEGLAVALEALAGHDPGDEDSLDVATTGLADAVRDGAARSWRVAFCRGPAWARCEPDARSRMEAFVQRLRGLVEVADIDLPAGFEALHEHHMVIQDAGVAHHLHALAVQRPGDLSTSLLANVRRGREIEASRLREARDFQAGARTAMDHVFDEFDVVVGLAATGEAPASLATTGDPAMQTVWTFTGTPALSVPALRGAAAMPIGVQVCARRGRDANVLAFAEFLEHNRLAPA
jgi:Asp-tRNA(Asn)/Glu-tRNA(Gln) amidotransferase A subunit family amidase